MVGGDEGEIFGPTRKAMAFQRCLGAPPKQYIKDCSWVGIVSLLPANGSEDTGQNEALLDSQSINDEAKGQLVHGKPNAPQPIQSASLQQRRPLVHIWRRGSIRCGNAGHSRHKQHAECSSQSADS